MDYVQKGKYYSELRGLMVDAIRKNDANVEDASFSERTITMKNGDVYHFVSDEEFPGWCKGRTYRFAGEETVYHGEYPYNQDGVDMEEKENYGRIKDLLILQQYLDNRIRQEIESVISGHRDSKKADIKDSLVYIIDERLRFYNDNER